MSREPRLAPGTFPNTRSWRGSIASNGKAKRAYDGDVSSQPRVAIMLSDKFASRLDKIALTCHVWALRTPTMEAATRPIWDRRFHGESDSFETGVTLFEGRGSAEADLLAVVDEVELHHGALGLALPVKIIEVFGGSPTDAVREVFESNGLSRVETSADGFVAYRDPSWVDPRQ